MNGYSLVSLRRVARISRFVIGAVALVAIGILPAATFAIDATRAPDVTLLEDAPEGIVLHYQLGDFTQNAVVIDGLKYSQIMLGKESPIKKVGEPELPNICRSVIIPDDAQMAVRVIDASFYEISDIDIAPSKGILPRTINPADVPFTFGEVYETDAFYPGDLTKLRDPYIMRDFRAVVTEVYPFQYNPVTRVLRVYTDMTVEVFKIGLGQINVLKKQGGQRELSLAFHHLYDRHFMNYSPGLRYTPLDEIGDLLIICYDSWMANVQPLVDHKNATGINTTIVGVSTIGNNSTSIQNHIQNQYNTSDLAFVLLVGDYTQVATPSGAQDPTYALLAGGDHYPDIMVGRFSAETSGQVDTQVLRTVEYEQLSATSQDWFWKGTGIGSNDPQTGDDGEHDWEHIDNIRTDLLANGYTSVDQIYAPSATASQVTTALNAGRGIINYCGHGSVSAWSTTGFSSSNVNSLVNNNMLPFIISVACVNGDFDGNTCFGEAWLRATNGSEPTGAIGIYASSINQSWNPPMCAQDEVIDMYVAGTYTRFGTLCYAGSCQMMDEYGSSGEAEFDRWHVFGDPSLSVSGLRPPSASDSDAETSVNTPVAITLQANDDGFPNPPGAMVYIVTSLPQHGTLADQGAGDILAVPYTLVGGGNQVSFTPDTGYVGPDAFQFKANDGGVPPEGGDSNTATVSIAVGAAGLVYDFPMNSSPGWTTQGLWAFGTPTGGGGQYGGPDPTSGYTGSNVYGYNLNGDYENYLSESHLTSTAIDCSNLISATLKFRRWLGVERNSYDHAYVRISNNGSSWTTLWQNPDSETADSSWSLQEFDISSVADGQATVYLRWTMGTTDTSWQYCGWNIDDVAIWGISQEEETCDDGILNQGEDRIDCGGPCPPCECTSDGMCDNGAFCDGTETCDDYGDCQDGTFPCTNPAYPYCDEGQDDCDECVENAHCDDDLFCNGAETCVDGSCYPGDDPCPGQECDEEGDVCISANGDCDDDGDVDLQDFLAFQDCYTGPGGSLEPGCECADFDDDGDVDLTDFLEFQTAFTGPQ